MVYKQNMKLYVHGFWSGFLENTNPVGINFFIDLFKKVFNEEIEISSFEESELLLETIFDNKTFLFEKKWKYTFLFSGESRLRNYSEKYSCVLYGERNNKNIVNVPLFVPYLYSSNLLDKMAEKKEVSIPKKNICAIISNPGGQQRNNFLNELEKSTKVDYAGCYRTNVNIINNSYNSPDFFNFIKDYKFIISMENSRHDTYITEKITHGFIAGNIPVYWGSERVTDYFNQERFINVKHDYESSIKKIIDICNDDEKYLKTINENIFSEFYERTIYHISDDIKNVLDKMPNIDKIFVISSQQFEQERYDRLQKMFKDIELKEYHTKFICPTYKQTITDEIMNKNVKYNLVKQIRHIGMKKSEISLFLNYKAVLEHISRNYSDGIFLIFESDVYTIANTPFLTEFVSNISHLNWDLIHIGKEGENQYFSSPYMEHNPYRNFAISQSTPYIEDITNEKDKHRLIRKFHTRCTDSFLWKYKGVCEFLEFMKNNTFEVPFDYYMSYFFETNQSFRHYWSMDTFFIQGTNCGLEKSTIQNDSC